MSDATHIYLVRHGQKKSEFGDPPLTELGEKQAEVTAKHFGTYKIDVIISSPLLRAQQTADFIAREVKLSIVTDDRLRERANWDDTMHKTFTEFEQMWLKSTAERTWQPPVGVSSFDAGKRMAEAMYEQAMVGRERVVFATHGGIISDVVRNLFSNEETDALIPNFSVITDAVMHECSITEIVFEVSKKRPTLITLASVTHLPQALL